MAQDWGSLKSDSALVRPIFLRSASLMLASLNQFDDASISEADRRKIGRTNALSLFKLPLS